MRANKCRSTSILTIKAILIEILTRDARLVYGILKTLREKKCSVFDEVSVLTYVTDDVKEKLERDYNKLSPRTRDYLKERYENIINILFVNK